MSESTSRCKSCGAAVIWLMNADTGRIAPIDAAPSADGNIAIDDDRYHVVPKAKRSEHDELHKNHFVTCPQAKQWGSKR